MNTKEVYFGEYCSHCIYSQIPENQKPCCDCLKEPYNINSHQPVNFIGKYYPQPNTGYYDSLLKVDDYLWKALYLHLDYKYAYNYYKHMPIWYDNKKDNPLVGGCSSIRYGKYYIGRNLDWFYNDSSEFIVKTAGIKGVRYATLGVVSTIPEFTDPYIESGCYDPRFKILPFQLVDGINSQGVFASINVVPNNQGHSRYYIPAKDSKGEICSLMLIRYILDNFATAKEAVNYIRDHITVWFTDSSINMGYEAQYMVADINNTYVINFIDNNGKDEIWVKEISDKPYMTNFRLHGVEFNDDGTVYTPETMDEKHDAIKTNHIEPLGSGLERYNAIVESYDNLPYTAPDFMYLNSLLKMLTYTKAYPSSPNPANPTWYTEFVGSRNLTVNSPVENYIPVVEIADERYVNRSRSDKNMTWHTVHKSIYDIESKTLMLQNQEDYMEGFKVYRL